MFASLFHSFEAGVVFSQILHERGLRPSPAAAVRKPPPAATADDQQRRVAVAAEIVDEVRLSVRLGSDDRRLIERLVDDAMAYIERGEAGWRRRRAPDIEVGVVVLSAAIGTVPWRRGDCLQLRLRDDHNRAIAVSVPMEWDRLVEAVRKSFGVSSDIVPDEFVGQRARVVLGDYLTKDGTKRLAVRRWIPKPVRVAPPAGITTTLDDAIFSWRAAR